MSYFRSFIRTHRTKNSEDFRILNSVVIVKIFQVREEEGDLKDSHLMDQNNVHQVMAIVCPWPALPKVV